MRIIAAYMLAVLGGNQNPDAAAVKKVLDSVGSKYDEKRIDALIAELAGKDLAQLIAAGNAKLAALGPVGGGGGGHGGGGGGGAHAVEEKKGGKDEKKGGDKGADKKGGDKGGDKKGKPKDEPKEEPKADEEEGGDIGMSLFD